MKRKNAITSSQSAEVDAFLMKVAATPPSVAQNGKGRLIFALDATASREPTWDQACDIQAQMFTDTSALGNLLVQLAWYRGFREFQASPWLSDSPSLLQTMSSVRCLGGRTQIGRLLQHACNEARQNKINALVFIGDAFEEDIDQVCQHAGELGMYGVPVFLFHEGNNADTHKAFSQIARLSKGAVCSFDPNSPQQLRNLLAAVAVYAVGGRKALTQHGRRHGDALLQLTQQLKL